MYKNSFLATLLVVFGMLLVSMPETAGAQTQPSYGSASLHPHTITLPSRAMYRGEMKFTLTLKDTVAFADTLVVPEYDSLCTIHLTRVSKGGRAPGVIDNHPWISTLVPNRGKLILVHQKADTVTYHFTIKKPY